MVGPVRPRDVVDPGRLSGEAGVPRQGPEELLLFARPLRPLQELDDPSGRGAGLLDEPAGLLGVRDDRLDDRLGVVAPELLERPARARFVHIEGAFPRGEHSFQGPTFDGGRLERVRERLQLVPETDPSREECRAAGPLDATVELRGEGIEEPGVRELAELVIASEPARKRREGRMDALRSPPAADVQLHRNREVRRRVGSRGPVREAREEVPVALRTAPADPEPGPRTRPTDLEERPRLAGLQMGALEARRSRVLDEPVREVGHLLCPELGRGERGEAGAVEGLAGREEVEALAGPLEVPQEKPVRLVRLLHRDLGLPVGAGERGVGDLSVRKGEGDDREGLRVEVEVEEASVRPRQRVPPVRELLEAARVVPRFSDRLELSAPTVEPFTRTLRPQPGQERVDRTPQDLRPRGQVVLAHSGRSADPCHPAPRSPNGRLYLFPGVTGDTCRGSAGTSLDRPRCARPRDGTGGPRSAGTGAPSPGPDTPPSGRERSSPVERPTLGRCGSTKPSGARATPERWGGRPGRR